MRLPLIARAVEELKMLTQTDIERERYESRRKAQLDHNSEMKAARMQGLAEGRVEGRVEGRTEGLSKGQMIGVIQLCEQLLKRSETPLEQLAGVSLEELTRLASELQAQLPGR
jgi:flagellar biosynthesis/type III secretory pathway protein FliH